MTTKRKIYLGLILLTLLSITFAFGSVFGFYQGYSYRVFQASVGDAYQTFRVLEMINSGDSKSAKKSLEMELDTRLIEHWGGLINKPLNLSLLPENHAATNRLMSYVVAYRKTRPAIIDDEQVKKAIETVVNRYQ